MIDKVCGVTSIFCLLVGRVDVSDSGDRFVANKDQQSAQCHGAEGETRVFQTSQCQYLNLRACKRKS